MELIGQCGTLDVKDCLALPTSWFKRVTQNMAAGLCSCMEVVTAASLREIVRILGPERKGLIC